MGFKPAISLFKMLLKADRKDYPPHCCTNLVVKPACQPVFWNFLR